MDKLIPDLDPVGTLQLTDLYELWQGGPESKKVTLSDLLAFIQANISAGGFIRVTKDITGLTNIDMGSVNGSIIVTLTGSGGPETIESLTNAAGCDVIWLMPEIDVTFNDASLTTKNIYLNNKTTKTAFGTAKGFIQLLRMGTEFREVAFTDQYA